VETRGQSRGQLASCARHWMSVLLNRLIGQSTLSDQLLTTDQPRGGELQTPLTITDSLLVSGQCRTRAA